MSKTVQDITRLVMIVYVLRPIWKRNDVRHSKLTAFQSVLQCWRLVTVFVLQQVQPKTTDCIEDSAEVCQVESNVPSFKALDGFCGVLVLLGLPLAM